MQYTLLYTKDLNWTKGFSRSQKRCGFRLNCGDMCWKEESCQITFDCKPFVTCLSLTNILLDTKVNGTWFDRCFHIGSHNSLRYVLVQNHIFPFQSVHKEEKKRYSSIILQRVPHEFFVVFHQKKWVNNSHPLMEGPATARPRRLLKASTNAQKYLGNEKVLGCFNFKDLGFLGHFCC